MNTNEIEGENCDSKGLLTGKICFQDRAQNANNDTQNDQLSITKFLEFLCDLSSGQPIDINVGDLANQLSTSKWNASAMIKALVKAGAIHFTPFNLIGHTSATVTAPACSDSEHQNIVSAFSNPPETISKKQKTFLHLCKLSEGKSIYVTQMSLQKQLKITLKDIAVALNELHIEGKIMLKTGRGGSKTTVLAPAKDFG